ncbi:MAG: nucleotide exchange factor GrpE [Sphingobacteriales bacterium]|nr:MAG: nucleotide exchange factor GrpE [Sphingobacteriales bacterium]
MHENESDYNQELNEKNAAQHTEEAMAHGLNTDDSISGNGLPDFEGENSDSGSQKELDEAKDKYLRLAAEFENYKRRVAKERMELMQTAGREAIQAMLPVLDDGERAEKMIESATDATAMKEGIQLVFNKLRNTMKQLGLRRMDSAGEPFDAELHEAITEIPVPNEAQQGAVIDVIEPGYYLNDKLIRHAKVVVGK